MSSGKDRESAVTRLEESFGGSYKVEFAKMLLQKLTVEDILPYMPKNYVMSAIC